MLWRSLHRGPFRADSATTGVASGRTGVRAKVAVQLRAQIAFAARRRPTPTALTAKSPQLSPAFPASVRSLRALARGRRGPRRGGQSIGTAWQALAPSADPNYARPALSRSRGRSQRLLLQGPDSMDRAALSRELNLAARNWKSQFLAYAAVAARHVWNASSRRTRSVRRDVRWRWTLKVLWTAA